MIDSDQEMKEVITRLAIAFSAKNIPTIPVDCNSKFKHYSDFEHSDSLYILELIDYLDDLLYKYASKHNSPHKNLKYSKMFKAAYQENADTDGIVSRPKLKHVC